MKDWLLQKGAEAALGALLRDYGTVRSLRLDSVERWCEAHVELHGETEALRVRIEAIQFRAEGQEVHARVGHLETSREWMTRLGRRLVVGREFPLPPAAAAAVRFLL